MALAVPGEEELQRGSGSASNVIDHRGGDEAHTVKQRASPRDGSESRESLEPCQPRPARPRRRPPDRGGRTGWHRAIGRAAFGSGPWGGLRLGRRASIRHSFPDAVGRRVDLVRLYESIPASPYGFGRSPFRSIRTRPQRSKHAAARLSSTHLEKEAKPRIALHGTSG